MIEGRRRFTFDGSMPCARILPIERLALDTHVAEAWGRLAAKRPLPVVDGLLAATALVHNMTLVTRDTRDIADTGVRTINPWDA